MENTYFGKLVYNDEAQFEIHNDTGIINITKILDNIFDSGLRPLVDIKIYKNGILLFDEQGGLFLHTDDQKVESYFVCSLNLSKLLFYNTGNNLEICIKHERKSKNNE
jgi:hypothetical protein